MTKSLHERLELSKSISVEFPVARRLTYLNTAFVGLIPKSTIDSTHAFFRRYLTDCPYPDIFEDLEKNLEISRREFANWIGARREEISFQANSSTSLNYVVSMVDPKIGENVVVDDLGFMSATFPLIASQKKGVDIKWIKNENGLIRAEDYARVMNHNTKLVIVSLVSWINGLRAEVEEITKMAHEHGALCMIDSTQATGYLPIDVRKWNIDFLTTSNYKWLLSTFGASEFFCAKGIMEKFDLPPHLGWHSAPKRAQTRGLSPEKMEIAKTARGFEAGNPDYFSVYMLIQSLRVMSRFGRGRITSQTLKLSAIVNDGLRKIGLNVLSPPDKKHLSAIVFAFLKGTTGRQLATRLRKRAIHVTPQPYHGQFGVRISPYFYNTEEDVETFLDAVRQIMQTL